MCFNNSKDIKLNSTSLEKKKDKKTITKDYESSKNSLSLSLKKIIHFLKSKWFVEAHNH